MSKVIKVIDLLNKIANGEEVPKEIEFGYERFYCTENLRYKNKNGETLGEAYSLDKMLDDEVEIIEEEPEIDIQGIEELEEYSIQGLEVSGYSMTQGEYLLEDGIEENREIINELIKAVKQLDHQMNGDKQAIKRR